jgi:histidinol phosphatase-like enzyme
MITIFNTSLFILYYYITTRTHTKNGLNILFFIVPVAIDEIHVCLHHQKAGCLCKRRDLF